MKLIRNFFRVIAWLLLIAVIMGGLYAWKSGIAESFYYENEESLEKIGYELEKVFQSGAEKISELIPVHAVGKAVDPSQILNLTGSGINGDGYSFDPVWYPYYSMLSETEKSLYRQAYANAKAYAKTFVPSVRTSCNELKNAIEALFYDHPELFWMDTGYSYLYGAGDVCVQVTLQFLMDASEIPAAKESFDAAVVNIASQAAYESDILSREKAVHDAIARSVVYNADAPMCQSAYSALCLGESVCAGYSRAFQHVLMSIGIPAYYCAGNAGGDHSWNIVMLDSGYYNVDLTWDDNIATIYSFFNRTDEEFSSTHTREGLSVYLPECSATEYRGRQSLIDSFVGWIAPAVQGTTQKEEVTGRTDIQYPPSQETGGEQILFAPDTPERPDPGPADNFGLPGGNRYDVPTEIILG